MLGIHGNGLTHAIWMDPRRRPILMEFFVENGFSTDYEYPSTPILFIELVPNFQRVVHHYHSETT